MNDVDHPILPLNAIALNGGFRSTLLLYHTLPKNARFDIISISLTIGKTADILD